MKSFLLLGQSNMAGRGDFEDVPSIYNNLCFMLRNGRWQPMSEPINPDRSVVEPFSKEGNLHSGRCLAASFADDFAKHYNEKVGLIPCADGGTSLEDWQVNGLLYDHAVMQAKLAMRTSQLIGILWHQGEAECSREERATTYIERFLPIINGIRCELGVYDIPVVLGELGHFVKDREKVPPYFDTVQEALNTLGKRYDMATASAEGLGCRPDGIHFHSAALRELGHRYFAAYRSIVRD